LTTKGELFKLILWCQGTTSGMMETVCLHTRTWQWHCLGILFL